MLVRAAITFIRLTRNKVNLSNLSVVHAQYRGRVKRVLPPFELHEKNLSELGFVWRSGS